MNSAENIALLLTSKLIAIALIFQTIELIQLKNTFSNVDLDLERL